jgi:hypothetical protein
VKLWNREPTKLWNHEPAKLWNHEPAKLWNRRSEIRKPMRRQVKDVASKSGFDVWTSGRLVNVWN